MNFMKRYVRYLMLLIAGVLFLACSDEVNNKEPLPIVSDDYVGSVRHFLLGDETANFSQSDVRCYLMTEDGQTIMRYCTHIRRDSTSEVVLTTGLKDGVYRLLYFEYDLRKNNGPVRRGEFGLGGRIKVANGQIVMLDSFNAAMGFVGQGTKESPYIISSAKHLQRLSDLVNSTLTNKYVNNSTYFAQYADIDVDDLCWDSPDGYGWYPIGFTNVLPFRGHYNGKGYSIKGLYSYRNVTSGVGLFGYIHTAEIDSVVLDGAEIYGLYATGGIAGAVITAAGERHASTINHCRVVNSLISGARTTTASVNDVDTWSASIGGIVGAVDAYSIFLANGCSVDSESIVNGANCVGGILGAANLKSSIQISNCKNSAVVNAAYAAVGGIVGNADTVHISACVNTGAITGAIKYTGPDGVNPGVAAGGIIGGSGISMIVACANSGDVKGYDGVGGIIGSTRLGDGSETFYNNTTLRYCLNSGKVNGNNSVAGICGEAQVTGYALCNRGVINGNESVAGVLGFSPISALCNCVNSESVSGHDYVAGIVAQSTWGSMALNQNYGAVEASGNCAAGIAALVGDNVIINYCENGGNIMVRGSEPKAGGVVGELGVPNEWDAERIAGVVIGGLECITAVASVPYGFVIDKTISNKVLMFVLNAVPGLMYLPADLYFNISSAIALVDSKQSEEISKENNEQIGKLCSDITTQIQGIRNINGRWQQYRANVEALRVQCEAIEGKNIDSLYNNLNIIRNERADEVHYEQEQKDMIHTAVGGICIIAGTVASIVAAIPTGGASVMAYVGAFATGVAVGAGFLGGVNGIVQSVTEYEYNSSTVSQDLNYGKISAPNATGGYVGGVVGSTSDYAIIRDCLNLADCDAPGAKRGQMTGRANPEAEIHNSLAIGNASGWSGFAGTDKFSVTYGGLYYYLSGQTNVSGNYKDQGTELNSSQLGNSNSFSGWNIGSGNSLWSIQNETSPAYPIPLNSEAM